MDQVRVVYLAFALPQDRTTADEDIDPKLSSANAIIDVDANVIIDDAKNIADVKVRRQCILNHVSSHDQNKLNRKHIWTKRIIEEFALAVMYEPANERDSPKCFIRDTPTAISHYLRYHYESENCTIKSKEESEEVVLCK